MQRLRRSHRQNRGQPTIRSQQNREWKTCRHTFQPLLYRGPVPQGSGPFFVFTLPLPGEPCSHRAACRTQPSGAANDSLKICSEAAPALAVCEALQKCVDGFCLAAPIRFTSGVPRHHRQRAPRSRHDGMCMGSRPMCSESTRRSRTGRSRLDTAEVDFAPVMEPAYMPASEAGSWEFESPLGHQINWV